MSKYESKVPLTESNDDWIRAARLKKLAKEGDEEARKEFDRMDSSEVILGPDNPHYRRKD
jgi:hypothetical protein